MIMPGADDLRLAGLHGLPAPLIRFLEEGLGGPDDPLRACARRRRVLAAPRLGDDDRFDERWQRIADECGYRSLLAAPVEAPRSEEGGLVLVFFAEERRFADDDLELARNLTAAARGSYCLASRNFRSRSQPNDTIGGSMRVSDLARDGSDTA